MHCNAIGSRAFLKANVVIVAVLLSICESSVSFAQSIAVCWLAGRPSDQCLADIRSEITRAPAEDAANLSKLRLRLATSHRKRGENALALMEADKAIALDQENAPALVLRGSLKMMSSQYDAALTDYRANLEALKRKNSSDFDVAMGATRIAEVLERVERWSEAIDQYSFALDLLEKSDIEVFAHGGVSVVAKGMKVTPNPAPESKEKADSAQPPKNLADVLKPVGASSYAARIFVDRSEAYARLGDFEKSDADAAKAKELGARIRPRVITTIEKK